MYFLEDSITLTEEKSEKQKAQSPTWAWRPNTFTVSRKELVRITHIFQVKNVTFHFHFFIFTFHFYSNFQAMLAVQTNCTTVEDCHRSYGINQDFLDMVEKSPPLSLFHFYFQVYQTRKKSIDGGQSVVKPTTTTTQPISRSPSSGGKAATRVTCKPKAKSIAGPTSSKKQRTK